MTQAHHEIIIASHMCCGDQTQASNSECASLEEEFVLFVKKI